MQCRSGSWDSRVCVQRPPTPPPFWEVGVRMQHQQQALQSYEAVLLQDCRLLPG